MTGPRSGPGIVVVGDALLDRDVEGTADRLSPDAPVPVLDERASRRRPGGAALVAAFAALDGEGEAVTLVSAIGDDPAGHELRSVVEALGVEVVALDGGPTPEKIRFLVDDRPVLRVDRGGPPSPPGPLSGAARAGILDAEVVIVADYGRGLASDADLRAVLARRHGLTLWDPHRRGAEPVRGMTLVTPNRIEVFAGHPTANLPGSGKDSLGPVVAAAKAAASRWQAAVAVTLGSAGAILVNGPGAPLVIPAALAAGGDPCGAGDRFIAAVAGRLRRGAVLSEAVAGAVADATRYVAGGGARSMMVDQTMRRAASAPAAGVRIGGDEVALAVALAERVRASGGMVVVAGGCFDLIHAGHVALLESARRLGDCLIVALNSDASVRRIKGPGRPVVPQADRAALLSALSCVDAVASFDEDSPNELLRRIRPGLFAKGGDYSARILPEADVLAAWGGQAVVLPYLAGRSTTRLLQLAGRAP